MPTVAEVISKLREKFSDDDHIAVNVTTVDDVLALADDHHVDVSTDDAVEILGDVDTFGRNPSDEELEVLHSGVHDVILDKLGVPPFDEEEEEEVPAEEPEAEPVEELPPPEDESVEGAVNALLE